MGKPTTPEGSEGQAPSSDQTYRSVEGKQGPEYGNQSPAQATMPKPIEHPGDAEKSTKHGKAEGVELNAKERITGLQTERFALFTLIATGFLSAATLWLAVATSDLAHSTRDLVDLAKQQAHDTQDALKTSARQATAAEDANRLNRSPSVIIGQVNIPAPVLNTDLNATVLVLNIGHSPAHALYGRLTAHIQPSNYPVLAAIPEKCVNCGTGALLFPTSGLQTNGLQYPASIKGSEITAEIVDGIRNKTYILYIIGEIDFIDPDSQSHFIKFCQVYSPSAQGSTSPCAIGNSTD